MHWTTMGKEVIGYDVFDMLVNQDIIGGNANIVLKNLTIDGNRLNDLTDPDDDLRPDDNHDRYSGLKFSNVSDSKLMNIKEYHHKCLRYGSMPIYLLEKSKEINFLFLFKLLHISS